MAPSPCGIQKRWSPMVLFTSLSALASLSHPRVFAVYPAIHSGAVQEILEIPYLEVDHLTPVYEGTAHHMCVVYMLNRCLDRQLLTLRLCCGISTQVLYVVALLVELITWCPHAGSVIRSLKGHHKSVNHIEYLPLHRLGCMFWHHVGASLYVGSVLMCRMIVTAGADHDARVWNPLVDRHVTVLTVWACLAFLRLSFTIMCDVSGSLPSFGWLCPHS